MTKSTDDDLPRELLRELRTLLAEPPDAARERERRLLAQIDSQTTMPIVLFGAGNLGRRTASLLRAHGRPAAAFMDNDARLWGTSVDGLPVLSPGMGSARFSADGTVVVTIWRAEGGHDFLVTRDDLRSRGWRRVESFIPLFWGLGSRALPYITIDVPSRVLAAETDILATAQLWSDERSLRDYVGQIQWRLNSDFGSLPAPEPDQYFVDDLVRLGPDEVFVDCGAFIGDTMLEVARRAGSWRSYHAFEPDPSSFSKLREAVASLPAPMSKTTFLHEAAAADHHGILSFDASGLASASLDEGGAVEVDCLAIDDVVSGQHPTFVKMDIEGAEAAALQGAKRSIQEGRPVLAVAAYHRQADIWELPSLIHEMAPDYRLFLRPHAGEGFETVLYAVPPGRVVKASPLVQ